MKHFISILGCVLFANFLQTNAQLTQLMTIAEWKQLDFCFPTEQERERAIASGQFVAANAAPIDVDVHYTDRTSSRIFVTIPRFTTGVPITLGVITTKKSANGPIITAYPSYEWHSSHGADCDGITSVLRITIDECNRLWVIDNGKVDTTYFCPPQILVFDLSTDTLINRYRFPDAQSTNVSLLTTVVVDVRDPPPIGQCRDTKVYLADVRGFGLVVYDLTVNRSWRVTNKRFFPTPTYGTYTIAGESFDLMDGVFGVTVSKKRGFSDRSERYLYFHSLASMEENRVPLRIIDNESLWQNITDSNTNDFKSIGVRGTQSTSETFDMNGNLFFGLVNPIAIACWDSDMPYNPRNIKVVAQNDQTLQFTSGIKIIKDLEKREELWAVSNRFQKISTGSINFNEINFRIQVQPIRDLLRGQPKCNGRDLSSFKLPDFGMSEMLCTNNNRHQTATSYHGFQPTNYQGMKFKMTPRNDYYQNDEVSHPPLSYLSNLLQSYF